MNRNDEAAQSTSVAPLVVRRALVDDWRELRDIRLEALCDTPEAYGSTYEDASHTSADRWRTMIERQCYFLAVGDGHVLGMVSGGLNDDHPDTHWLYGMYVTPSARGTTVAPMLVDAVVRWAKDEGARNLYLHVAPSVTRARVFYEKMGFSPTGDGRVLARDPTIVLATMSRSLDGL